MSNQKKLTVEERRTLKQALRVQLSDMYQCDNGSTVCADGVQILFDNTAGRDIGKNHVNLEGFPIDMVKTFVRDAAQRPLQFTVSVDVLLQSLKICKAIWNQDKREAGNRRGFVAPVLITADDQGVTAKYTGYEGQKPTVLIQPGDAWHIGKRRKPFPTNCTVHTETPWQVVVDGARLYDCLMFMARESKTDVRLKAQQNMYPEHRLFMDTGPMLLQNSGHRFVLLMPMNAYQSDYAEEMGLKELALDN